MGARSSTRRQWKREELLLVLHLYYRISFGRQHSRAPEVIELSKILNRTPSSVAMKLNNFTSLDPSEALRGVRGLPGASNLDRQIWYEFHANKETMAAESEALWQFTIDNGRFINTEGNDIEKSIAREIIGTKNVLMSKTLSGPTEEERMIRVRLVQDFFRRSVLATYNYACCISGIPMPELLVASHIVPWSDYPDQRINPHNGLCLSRLHDAAFDRYLITLDEEYRLVIGKSLREHLSNEALQSNFLKFEGQSISLPEKFLPDQQLLAIHRDKFNQ